MGKKNTVNKKITLSSLEEDHLKVMRGESIRKEDTTEFEALFEDISRRNGRNNNKGQQPTDEDDESLEYFKGGSLRSFVKSDFANDKNLHVTLTKQMEKEGIDKAFGKKLKSNEEEEQDEEEEGNMSEEEDVDSEEDDETLETKYAKKRGDRSYVNDDVVKHRLPLKGADGTLKKISEVYINPEVKEDVVKGVQKHPKQILKEKEEQAAKEKLKQQQAIKKQKLDLERKKVTQEAEEDEEEEESSDEEDVEELINGEKLNYTEMEIEASDSDDDDDMEEEEEQNGQIKKKKKLSEAELYLQRQQNLEQSKVRIAQLSTKIIENPEQHIGLLNDMFAICLKNIDMVVKKLSILSLCAIFKDIIPGYKISSQLHKEDKESKAKPGDDQEKAKKEKLSKEMKQTRMFEAKLLKYYQNFLVLVEGTVENVLSLQAGRKPSHHNAFFTSHQINEGSYTLRDLQSILGVVVRVASTLLVSKPHFNFRTNLVTLTTRFTVYRDKQIAAECIKSIHDLFRNDTTGGQTALEVVRCMSNVAKATNYMLDPNVLRVFNSIYMTDAVEKVNPLGAATDAASYHGKKRRHFTQKEKKDRRADKKLEKEMQEAEAEFTMKEQRYLQTEILKSIFITYFRIIKQAPHSPALTAVLEGLVKFAHLISVDFLPDLLAALASLIGRETISLGNALNTSITAFKTVKQHGHTLNVDLKEYFSRIYSLMPDLVLPQEQQYCLPAVSALSFMLGERKHTAVDRVASFIKRIATISTALPPNASLALIALIKQLFVSFPRVQSLIENDNSYRSGAYNGETPDPDHCNPFSTSLWELTFYYSHWHPQFEPIVKRFLSFNETTASQVGRDKNPTDIFHLYDNSLGGFNPPIQPPKEHPLESRLKKQQQEAAANPKKKKKQNPLFIQVAQSEPSSFLSSITEKVDSVDDKNVSFANYFNEHLEYETQMQLKDKLSGVKKIQLKMQQMLLSKYAKQEKEEKLKKQQQLKQQQQQPSNATQNTNNKQPQQPQQQPQKPTDIKKVTSKPSAKPVSKPKPNTSKQQPLKKINTK